MNRQFRTIAAPLVSLLHLVLVCTANGAGAARAAEALTIDSVVLRAMVEAEVPARQTGVLSRIETKEGAVVQQGELLAALDERAATLALQHAQLELEQADAKARNTLTVEYAAKAIEVARAELKRSKESNEKFANSISQSQLDVEQLTIEKLELERREAEHELELARFDRLLKENAVRAAALELDLHQVRAPFSGVVALVRGRAGEWVEPGANVLRLVAVDVLRAEGFAPAEVVRRPLLGAAAWFTIDAGTENAEADDTEEPRRFAGRLAFVSPEIDPVTRQVRIWAEIDNRQEPRLWPGLQGQLKVDLP